MAATGMELGGAFSRSSFFSLVKAKQTARRRLLAQQFGLSDARRLRLVLGRSHVPEERDYVDRKVTMLPRRRHVWPSNRQRDRLKKTRGQKESTSNADGETVNNSLLRHSSSIVEPSLTGGAMEDATEEFAYTDSTTFLKGTQSANPHNDYCQHFVDTGERPQNFIRDTGLANRFEEYPKLRELIRLKDEQIQKTATPPMYLKCDLLTFDLRELQCKFDVILVEPPLEEYSRTQGAVYDRYWNWEEIEQLEIEQIAAQRSFLWIWCGSGEGLDLGRKCLRKWGFRRCEDICWIKTNKKNPGHKNLEPKAGFQRTKEHCLMGIKGTVRRSTDGDFIHANVDIDLIIEEEAPYGHKDRPVEIFHIIEHFCLGRRRLHLFGRDSQIRQGWLTVGPELTGNNFDARTYSGYFTKDQNGNLTGTSEEIERLRPKSPPPRGQKNVGTGGGGGGSAGGGGGGGTGGGAGTSGTGLSAAGGVGTSAVVGGVDIAASSAAIANVSAVPLTVMAGATTSSQVPGLVTIDTGIKDLGQWDMSGGGGVGGAGRGSGREWGRSRRSDWPPR